MCAQHEDACALAELDREGLAGALRRREAMAREGDAAVLEVSRERGLPRGIVTPAQQTGQRQGRIVAGQNRLEWRRRPDRAARAATEQPPQRP
jgi:hypothetical protein